MISGRLRRVLTILFTTAWTSYCPTSVLAQEAAIAASLSKFTHALVERQRGVDILEHPPSERCIGAFCTSDASDFTTGIRHLEVALQHAEQLDARVLDSLYHGWGEAFDSKFRSGLRLMLSSFKTDAGRGAGQDAWIRGQSLLNEWAHWYNVHSARIRRSR